VQFIPPKQHTNRRAESCSQHWAEKAISLNASIGALSAAGSSAHKRATKVPCGDSTRLYALRCVSR
jgi:hypothetical protein